MSKSSGKQQWLTAAAAFTFLVGYGLALHDFAHQVWQLKGTAWSVEGGYIGFAMMAPVALGCLVVFMSASNTAAKKIRVRRSAVTEDEPEWFYPSKEHEGT